MTNPSLLTASGRVRLRPADEGHAHFAESLYLEMVRSLLPDASEDDMRTHFRGIYRQDQTFAVARDDRVVGSVQIEDGPGQVVLSQIHLVPAYQGLGIGGGLIAELLDQARAEGKAVELDVFEANPALALYRRLGFEVVGRDEPRLRMRWEPGPSPAGEAER